MESQQMMCQQEQMAQQSQQMMLCPVRVVYETQILVPPGDQIQPNQTIYINPHNPPPWLQNRIQNQVVYVQQMNSQPPQQIDQNMFFQPNYQNYQQVQPMFVQEHIRPNYQITNMMPNVVANVGQNISPNIQPVPERPNIQAYNPNVAPQNSQNIRVNQISISHNQNIEQKQITNEFIRHQYPQITNTIPNVYNVQSIRPVRPFNPNIGQTVQPVMRPIMRPRVNKPETVIPRPSYRPRLQIQNTIPSSIQIQPITTNKINTINIVNRKRKSESPEIKTVNSSTQVEIQTPLAKQQVTNFENKVLHANLPQISKILQNTVKIDKSVLKNASQQTDDRIRNTVYTQARGRLINEVENTKIENKNQNINTNINNNLNNEILKVDTPKIEVNPLKVEKVNITDTFNEIDDSNIKAVYKDMQSTNLVKKDNDYILTHVLDGFVIQESNIAFPIRKPLKEKSLNPNTNDDDKELIKETNDIGDKNESVDIKEKESAMHMNKDNPFADLKPVLVKSWTVEELTCHLSKYEWNDTSSLLRDHEIDGESLFLVSKAQLLTIGVQESHADVICEFVHS